MLPRNVSLPAAELIILAILVGFLNAIKEGHGKFNHLDQLLFGDLAINSIRTRAVGVVLHSVILPSKNRLPQVHDRKRQTGQCLSMVMIFVAFTSTPATADSRGVKPMMQTEFAQHMVRLELSESQFLDAKQLFGTYQLEREEVDRALKKLVGWNLGHEPYTYHAADSDLAIDSLSTFNNVYSRWSAIIRDLEDRYFVGLKAVVPEKEDVVASLIRARMRLSMLDDEHIAQGAPYGTNLDLIAELQAIVVDNESVNQVVLEYEYSMHTALKQLAEAIIESESVGPRFLDPMISAVEQFGLEGAQAEIDALVMASAQGTLAVSRIRSLNERTFEKLLVMLPREDADRLRNQVYHELYPFLYAESEPIALYRRVQNLADLTDDQRVAIQSLNDEFVIRRDRELVALATVYRQSVGKDSILARSRTMVMVRATRDPSLGQSSAETLAFERVMKDWRAIEARYITRILGILTTEQRRRAK